MTRIEWKEERELISKQTEEALKTAKFWGYYFSPEDLAELLARLDKSRPTHLLTILGRDTQGVWGKLDHPRRDNTFLVYLQVKSPEDYKAVAVVTMPKGKRGAHTRYKVSYKLPAFLAKENLLVKVEGGPAFARPEHHFISLHQHLQEWLASHPE